MGFIEDLGTFEEELAKDSPNYKKKEIKMETKNTFEANLFMKPASGNDREKAGHLKIVTENGNDLLEILNDLTTKQIMAKIEQLHTNVTTTPAGNPVQAQPATQAQAPAQPAQQAPTIPYAQCGHAHVFRINSKDPAKPWSMLKCKDCGGVKFDGVDRKTGQPNTWMPPRA